jgi:hypothetical protein
LKSLEAKTAARVFASLLIALSGLVPISDKVINIELSNNYGFHDSATFIWTICQTLTPLLMAIGAFLKPFRISYTIPVYFYSIQLFWIFKPELKLDDTLTHIYALGCVIFFIVTVIFINSFFLKLDREKYAKINFLEKALDLSINLGKRS